MAISILRHVDYNAWANRQLADMLRNIPDDIFFRENKSSFSSISKTLLHLWGAQDIWLKRMQGTGLGGWPTGAVESNKRLILDGLMQSSHGIIDFVRMQGDAFLAKKYRYKNMKGVPFENSYEDTLLHVVNHGTYHRGQITTMLRQAEVESIVSTDMILFIRQAGN